MSENKDSVMDETEQAVYVRDAFKRILEPVMKDNAMIKGQLAKIIDSNSNNEQRKNVGSDEYSRSPSSLHSHDGPTKNQLLKKDIPEHLRPNFCPTCSKVTHKNDENHRDIPLLHKPGFKWCKDCSTGESILIDSDKECRYCKKPAVVLMPDDINRPVTSDDEEFDDENNDTSESVDDWND